MKRRQVNAKTDLSISEGKFHFRAHTLPLLNTFLVAFKDEQTGNIAFKSNLNSVEILKGVSSFNLTENFKFNNSITEEENTPLSKCLSFDPAKGLVAKPSTDEASFTNNYKKCLLKGQILICLRKQKTEENIIDSINIDEVFQLKQTLNLTSKNVSNSEIECKPPHYIENIGNQIYSFCNNIQIKDGILSALCKKPSDNKELREKGEVEYIPSSIDLNSCIGAVPIDDYKGSILDIKHQFRDIKEMYVLVRGKGFKDNKNYSVDAITLKDNASLSIQYSFETTSGDELVYFGNYPLTQFFGNSKGQLICAEESKHKKNTKIKQAKPARFL